MKIVSCLFILIIAGSAYSKSVNLLPNPSFEEIDSKGMPRGWTLRLSDGEVEESVRPTAGKTRKDAHSGAASLQFSFLENTKITKAVWWGNQAVVGIPVKSGHYLCAFWIKAKKMLEGFNVTVRIGGFGENNAYIKEVTRSSFLTAQNLPDDDWVKITFPIEIPADEGIQTIAPFVVFLTSANGSLNPVPAATRILVDDIEITKK